MHRNATVYLCLLMLMPCGPGENVPAMVSCLDYGPFPCRLALEIHNLEFVQTHMQFAVCWAFACFVRHPTRVVSVRLFVGPVVRLLRLSGRRGADQELAESTRRMHVVHVCLSLVGSRKNGLLVSKTPTNPKN